VSKTANVSPPKWSGSNEKTPNPFDLAIILEIYSFKHNKDKVKIRVRNLYRPYQVSGKASLHSFAHFFVSAVLMGRVARRFIFKPKYQFWVNFGWY
jgi:hypothetical protein